MRRPLSYIIVSVSALTIGVYIWLMILYRNDEVEAQIIADLVKVELALIDYESRNGLLPERLLDLDQRTVEILKKHVEGEHGLIVVRSYDGSGGWVYSPEDQIFGLNKFDGKYVGKIRLDISK